MKIKGIILCILLACAVGISFPLYRFYAQEDITKQEAYEIGKNILTETMRTENLVITIADSVSVWYVHALCKNDGYDADFLLKSVSEREK